MSYLRRVHHATEDENRRVILETMPRRPGATLLDLGCARGEWTNVVAEHVGAARVLGVELVEEFAVEADRAGVEVTVTRLGERLPYADRSIDVVHSNQVIEHLPGTDVFMSEIARVLAPDGYAIVSTNNLSGWHNVASLVLGWQPPPCHVSDVAILGSPGAPHNNGKSEVPLQMHLRVFTGMALAALATYHGLRVEARRTAGYYPLPPRVARGLARIDPRHGAFLVQRYASARS